jgi:hypothetical protein
VSATSSDDSLGVLFEKRCLQWRPATEDRDTVQFSKLRNAGGSL